MDPTVAYVTSRVVDLSAFWFTAETGYPYTSGITSFLAMHCSAYYTLICATYSAATFSFHSIYLSVYHIAVHYVVLCVYLHPYRGGLPFVYMKVWVDQRERAVSVAGA